MENTYKDTVTELTRDEVLAIVGGSCASEDDYFVETCWTDP